MKPIEIVACDGGYSVRVNAGAAINYGYRGKKQVSGTVTRMPNGKLDIVWGAEPAIVDAERAKSLAHTIGRYKLGFGDLVFAYTDAPAGFFGGE